MESTRCTRCSKACIGETLRYNDQLFHATCLSCIVCGKELATMGFFVQDDHYFCPEDFQERFGTKCLVCLQFLEGEGITVGGNTYHESCFICAECHNTFPPGEKVVFNGKDYICQRCASKEPDDIRGQPLEKCAGCDEDIRSGQALLALEKQWHLWCFTCAQCGCLLAGEYMGRDGKAYCEKDYQAEFGVSCAGCGGYITGKVLQAGEKHYHPQCSRCARCHGVFGEGQEMYLQGSEIWHPDCSLAASQNGDQSTPGERNGSKDPHSDDDEDHRPPPAPTITSASRTTDWKVKYSPQSKREGAYSTDGWIGENKPSSLASHYSYRGIGPPASYGSDPYRKTTPRQQEMPLEKQRVIDSMSPLDLDTMDRQNNDKTLTYPYSDLLTTNYKLPRGVDKTKLETYLSDEDFIKVFSVTKDEFYRLPNWKQQSRKKEALLF